AFFFTSRRRHTRFSRDWSSDVCSSDLETGDRVDQRGLARAVRADEAVDLALLDAHGNILQRLHAAEPAADVFQGQDEPVFSVMRSEERRVGKECRCRWAPYDEERQYKH